MDYNKIMEFLFNKFGFCYTNADYYSKVTEWINWYKGDVPNFHKQVISNGISMITEDIKKLKMAKRVAEDWTSAVLADGLEIVVNANKHTRTFVSGSKNNGGVLGSNNFTEMLSRTLEKMFALGTCAIVADLDGIVVDGGNYYLNEDTQIRLQFYDAHRIIPLKYTNNNITDVAFLSMCSNFGKTVYNLSVHIKEQDGYVIYNYTLDDKYCPINNDKIVPVFRTMSKRPLFSIVRTNISNNVDLDSPMGVSVYSDSIDILKSIDQVYDACSRDVVTGQRLILMNKKLLGQDEYGNLIAPQDAKRTYMTFFGDEVSPSGDTLDNFVKEFTPKLNCTELDTELQNQLNILSNSVGLGTKFYNFDISTGVTATEYVGERNDFVRNSNKMKIAIVSAIKNIIQAILHLGGILNKNVQVDAKIDIKINDSTVESDIEKRALDKEDVKDGIMSKVEYRVKYYGETEDVATENLNKIPIDNQQ